MSMNLHDVEHGRGRTCLGFNNNNISIQLFRHCQPLNPYSKGNAMQDYSYLILVTELFLQCSSLLSSFYNAYGVCFPNGLSISRENAIHGDPINMLRCNCLVSPSRMKWGGRCRRLNLHGLLLLFWMLLFILVISFNSKTKRVLMRKLRGFSCRKEGIFLRQSLWDYH